MNSKIYLGHGVYAEFDGLCIWLSTDNGKIYLNPVVLNSLDIFREHLKDNEINETARRLVRQWRAEEGGLWPNSLVVLEERIAAALREVQGV